MNERIEKLIDQCIDQRWTVTGPMFDREKFAELIVKECAELNFRELGLSGSASFDVGRMIKQHFGVEE